MMDTSLSVYACQNTGRRLLKETDRPMVAQLGRHMVLVLENLRGPFVFNFMSS